MVVFLPKKHTSSSFLAGSADSLKGRGFLMSDQRPRFFKIAVLDTSLVQSIWCFLFLLSLNTRTCLGCKSESQGHIQRRTVPWLSASPDGFRSSWWHRRCPSAGRQCHGSLGAPRAWRASPAAGQRIVVWWEYHIISEKLTFHKRDGLCWDMLDLS